MDRQVSNYYETIYRHTSNAILTTAAFNTRWEHLDTRIDALERHIADLTNPHDVDDEDVGASKTDHTHTVREAVAVGDSSTSLAAGTINYTPSIMTGGTIAKVKATLVTATTSGAVTIDIQKSSNNGATWATIFSTKLTLDQDEKSSASATTAAVLSTTSLVANDLIKAIVDDAGTGASGLTVALELTRTVSED